MLSSGVFGLVTFPKCPKQLTTVPAMIFAQATAFIMPAEGLDYQDATASYFDNSDADEEYFYRILQNKSQINEKKPTDMNTGRVSTKVPFLSGVSPTNIYGFKIVFSIGMLFKVIMI